MRKSLCGAMWWLLCFLVLCACLEAGAAFKLNEYLYLNKIKYNLIHRWRKDEIFWTSSYSSTLYVVNFKTASVGAW